MMPTGAPGDSLMHPESDMGDMTTNEAAERLRQMDPDGSRTYLLDKALAAERRATVERIRERLQEAWSQEAALAILDEEAAR